MRRIRFFFVFILGFFSLWFVLLIGKTEGGEKLTKVTYGTPSPITMNSLPAYLGSKKGFYRDEGIELEFVRMTAPITVVALNAGNLDYSMVAGDTLRAAARGIPIKMVFICAHTLPQILVAKPEINYVKELKGKIIALPARLDSVYFGAYYIVKAHGLDPEKDLIFLPAGPGPMSFNALVAGAADAAMITHAEFLKARQRGFKQLVKTADYIKIPSLGIATSNKRIKEKRDEVKRMVRATLKGLLYVRTNKKESIDFLIKEGRGEGNIDPEGAPFLYEMGMDTLGKDGTVPDESLEQQIEIARKIGIVKGSVPLSQVADFSMLREVQKELGLK